MKSQSKNSTENKPKKKINSKKKGNRGELEFSKECIENGFEGSRRTQQYCGNNADDNNSDIVGVPGFHIEVKRVESLMLYAAVEQAIRDRGTAKKRIMVAHRRNKRPWVLVFLADEMLPFIKRYQEMEKQLGVVVDKEEITPAAYLGLEEEF